MEEILRFVEFNQYNLPFIIQILGLYLIMLYLALVAWVAKDITTRSQNFLVILTTVFFVLVGNLPALVIYLLVRPETTLDESKAQNLFQSSILDKKITNCGQCGCLVRTDYKYCPSCSSEVNQRCNECDHIVNPTWRYCSFCNYRLIPEPWYVAWPQNIFKSARMALISVVQAPKIVFMGARSRISARSVKTIGQNVKKVEKKQRLRLLTRISLPKIYMPKIRLPKIQLPKLDLSRFSRRPKTAKLSIMAEKKHPVKLEKKVIVGEMPAGKSKKKSSKAPSDYTGKEAKSNGQKKTTGRGRPKGLKDNRPRKRRADAGKKRGSYKK